MFLQTLSCLDVDSSHVEKVTSCLKSFFVVQKQNYIYLAIAGGAPELPPATIAAPLPDGYVKLS